MVYYFQFYVWKFGRSSESIFECLLNFLIISLNKNTISDVIRWSKQVLKESSIHKPVMLQRIKILLFDNIFNIFTKRILLHSRYSEVQNFKELLHWIIELYFPIHKYLRNNFEKHELIYTTCKYFCWSALCVVMNFGKAFDSLAKRLLEDVLMRLVEFSSMKQDFI